MGLNSLGEISKAQHHNSPIRIRAVVSGKSATPYKIPKRVKAKCLGCKDPECGYVKEKEIVIKPRDERFLLFVDIATVRIGSILKIAYRIPCKNIGFDVEETQNVLRIFVGQPPGEDRTKWMSAQTSYFVGHDIDSNHIYYLDGYATVDPKTQIATYVFHTATKSKSDIESFELSPKVKAHLKGFDKKFKTPNDVFAYLGDLYTSYANNVTKIYGRFMLHLAIDLVFHSALEFTLPGGRLQPARMDAIVLGDTRCGKGHVAEGLSNYYGIGEVVGAENSTFAGLVGGAQQISAHWVISWGRIPLNDRGLVIVDEASELKDTDWTRLSRIRSEGIAEVTKIQQQVTNARTRLVFLANPPSKAMANYTFGIHALKDLVHAPEDIARFDFACIVSHEEVSIEEINKKHETTEFLHTSFAERDLIMWIWSRSSDQIVFTDEALEEIFKVANRVGKFYDISIPLIQGENVRFKIAKIAIAFAGRLYSSIENGRKLRVKRLHVQCAATFIRGLYKADANGYFDHSWVRKELNPTLQQENIDALIAYFNAYPSQDEAYQYLLNNTYIQSRDIIEHLNVVPQSAVEIISKLLKFKCIVKKDTGASSVYLKTPHFTRWLRDRVRLARKNK